MAWEGFERESKTAKRQKKRKKHKHFTTGKDCSCGFVNYLVNPADYDMDPERLGKTAAKIDWLRQRHSEGDKFLNDNPFVMEYVERLAKAFPKIDPLLPWIVREVKKGRIKWDFADNGQLGLYINDPEGPYFDTIRGAEIDELADWYKSKHDTRKGVDIMQLTAGDVMQRVGQYSDELEAEKKKNYGEVVHTLPDNWTIRRLQNSEEAEEEGDQMGHCVGGYGSAIENGDTLIYSLRDPKNHPHATVEVEPTQHYKDPSWLERAFASEPFLKEQNVRQALEKYRDFMKDYQAGTGTKIPKEILDWQALYNHLENKYSRALPQPEGGNVVQIQGKENREPDPKYKDRLRQWFETFEDRPYHQDDENDYIVHPNDIEDHHFHGDDYNEYGLIAASPDVDWHDLVRNVGIQRGWGGQRVVGDHADKVYQLARAQKAIPQVAQELEEHESDARDHAYQQFLDFGQYPGPDEPAPNHEDFANDDDYYKALEAWEEEERESRDEAFSDWWDYSDQGQQLNHLYSLLRPHWDTKSGGYQNEIKTPGTFSSIRESRKLWSPGTWGKGLLVDGVLHTWKTWYRGGAPYHDDVLEQLGMKSAERTHERVKMPFWISPEGDVEASASWGPEYWDWRLEHELRRQEPRIQNITDEPDVPDGWDLDDWGLNQRTPGYDHDGMPAWIRDFGIDPKAK